MAPGKKKKRPAANPARGFATVSLPSKSKVLEDSESSQNDGPNIDETKSTKQNVTSKSQTPNSQSGHSLGKAEDLTVMSPEALEAHLEDAELQNLLDGSASRCKAEASRQATRLEVERRQLRDSANKLSTYSWLEDEVVNEAVEFHIKEMETIQKNSSLKSGPFDESKLMINVWTLEQVLLRLRFPKVTQVLKHVVQLDLLGKLQPNDSLWGLIDALEWYAMHVDSTELPDYEDGSTLSTRQDIKSNASIPSIDTEAPQTAKPTQKNSENKKAREKPQLELNDSPSEEEDDDDDDDDPSVLVDSYIRLKTSLWEFEEGTLPTDNAPKTGKRITRLRDKIKNIERDLLFDKDKADSIWDVTISGLRADRGRKIRAQRANAASKTNDKENDSDKPVPGEPSKKIDLDEQLSERKNNSTTAMNEDQDADLFGEMFGSTDDPPQGEAGEQASNAVRTIDFGKWTGLPPRRLLEETCRSLDAKSNIKVVSLQTTTYSARHKLQVFWSTSRQLEEQATSALPPEVVVNIAAQTWTIEMKGIAATDASQSEAYISTLALFLVSTLDGKDAKLGNRLPTVWRELLRDCMDSQKSLIEKADKLTLKRLRTLIQEVDAELNATRGNEINTVFQQKSLQKGRKPQDFRSNLKPFDSNKALTEWNSRASRQQFQEMFEFRSHLPIYLYKQDILDTISRNQTTVVCAQTGSGKSTQLGSFILEQELGSGRDCNILVTQPRRISAISLARRVSQELGEGRDDLGTMRSLIGYAIRLESKTSANTRLTFATTGVLLRMLESSANLEQLDYLILDEVHERTMDLDLLFIALRQLQERRPSLRVILMSATLDAKKLSSYFGGAPVIDVPGRTFPVEIGYLEDAVENTLDIKSSVSKSRADYEEEEKSELDDDDQKSESAFTGLEKYSSKTRTILTNMDQYRIDYELITKLAIAIATKEQYRQYSSAILIFVPGIGEIRRLHNTLLDTNEFSQGWIIHLLHSTFSTDVLERAFERPPNGFRKIVIATNIAETGITIPDVTAVIDTCKEKVMRFDERRQLSKLTEGFISRSSARQRRGRAARVQEGLCFHLVTKHRHDNLMLEQQVPEILRLSLQDAILRIKIWGLGSIEDTLAAALDQPSRKNIIRAVDKLKDAGALTNTEELTPLGHEIARLPLDVTLAKLAILGSIFKCLDATLAIISYLTSKSPFLSPHNAGQGPDSRKLFARADSDLISFLNAYEAWKRAKAARSAHEFCRKHHLSDQNLTQIEDQKIQLLVYLVDAGLVDLDPQEKNALNHARSGGGQRREPYQLPPRFNDRAIGDGALTSILALALYPRLLCREGKIWRNVYTNQQVSLSAKSINRDRSPKWLSFYTAMQTHSGNLNVAETTAVPESALALLLGATAEVKLFAGVLLLDAGRVRLAARHWRQIVALKIIRDRLAAALRNAFGAARGMALDQRDQAWLALWLRIAAAS